MRLKSEKAKVDGPGMARWGHAITSIAAALVLLGCGDPSLKEQALEAAVGRFEAIGVPEGYEQESLNLDPPFGELVGVGRVHQKGLLSWESVGLLHQHSLSNRRHFL